MAKAPAFQFYVRDWLTDPGLAACAASTRGIWIDLLALMWLAPERGTLRGQTMPELARLCRCSEDEVSAFLAECKHHKIAIVTERYKKVTITNRRMRREELLRKSNAQRQQRHRNGEARKRNGECHKKITPSSASASASALHTPPTPSRGDGERETIPSDPDMEIGGVGPPPRGPAIPPQVQAFRLLWTKAFCHDNPALTAPPSPKWLEAVEGWDAKFIAQIKPEDLRAAQASREARYWGPGTFLSWWETKRRARSPAKLREQKPLDAASAFALLPLEAREPWLAQARASLSGRSPPRGMDKWPESTVVTKAAEMMAAQKGEHNG